MMYVSIHLKICNFVMLSQPQLNLTVRHICNTVCPFVEMLPCNRELDLSVRVTIEWIVVKVFGLKAVIRHRRGINSEAARIEDYRA